ncbi:hypothetical protein BaRGS_00015650 [Batillaria attramentaria]|uniref:Uncharacterized protein n=1 Tax=Batillaria attramentaria TaxID=370345 RepID=A0ABD0L138_9CAEN
MLDFRSEISGAMSSLFGPHHSSQRPINLALWGVEHDPYTEAVPARPLCHRPSCPVERLLVFTLTSSPSLAQPMRFCCGGGGKMENICVRFIANPPPSPTPPSPPPTAPVHCLGLSLPTRLDIKQGDKIQACGCLCPVHQRALSEVASGDAAI